MIVVADVKPNFVLIAVILVTAVYGFMPGITWAFVAGLTANLLVGDALGSVPLTMLVVAAMVAGGSSLLGRMVWIYPVLATFLGSVVADVTSLVVGGLVSESPVARIPADVILVAALINAVLAGLVLYPVRAASARYATQEVGAW